MLHRADNALFVLQHIALVGRGCYTRSEQVLAWVVMNRRPRLHLTHHEVWLAERIDMAQETEDTRHQGATEATPAAATMPAPGGARLALALGVAKLAGSTGRMLKIGGGTSLPGMLARKIDPDVLRKVVGAS